MLKHIVMFRRKPGIGMNTEIEAAFFARLQHLDREIDLVRGWKLTRNELDRASSWLCVLESSFDDARALDDYMKHPAHQAIVGSLREYFEWATCDYTLT